MTRLMLFFKKTFMQNIYKLLSLYISSFSSDIHDVETSFFFTQKINTDIWPILVTLCFGGKKNTITSLGNMGMYHYTVGKNGQFFRHCDSNPQPIGITNTPVEMAKSLSFKCLDPRHIPKVRVFYADFRKVKIKIVDCPVSEIPTHKFWGKL